MSNILVVAGGTGGHIYPGLAIAEQIKIIRPESNIVFIGSHNGMEKNIIPKYGYKMEFIRAMGFEKKFSLQSLHAVKSIFDSIRDSKKVLRKYEPELVIGTGGYTCGMMLREAAKMKVPTMIHEQNAFPGRANRMLGKYVDRIAIAFEEAEDYFPAEKVFFTGNPVRNVFKKINRTEMCQALDIKPDEKMILAVGGSQGAESINYAMLELMKSEKSGDKIFCLITGKNKYEEIKSAYDKAGLSDEHRFRIIPYTTEMEKYIGASDLIICRSGASTIAEIAAVGVPSILIPYPFAAGDHQRINAEAIERLGGGVIIADADLNGSVLKSKVSQLFADPDQMEKMRESVKEYGTVHADKILAETAIGLIRNGL